jgi:hypothetical protein
MTGLKSVVIATLAGSAIVGGIMVSTITGAAAMPAAPLGAAATATSNVQEARIVCGPYRCWRRPNYYGYYGGYYAPRPYYYGPRFYGPGWGYRRRW